MATTALRDDVDVSVQILEELRVIRALLERQATAPRDPADEHLLREIASATRDNGDQLAFTAAALTKRAAHHPALASALMRADLVSTRMIGKWCQRMTGVEIDGRMLERVGDCRDGVLWVVRTCRPI